MLALGVAALCTATVHAQDKMAPAPKADHHCLTAADAGTWQKLALNPDQTKQVQEIQARCKTECAAAMKEGKDKAATAAIANKLEQELQGVLTPEQYTQWKDWCSKQPASSHLSTKPETNP
ncbi:MAG: hypothetical protein QM724_06580 [Flavobacteriales bacterium]